MKTLRTLINVALVAALFTACQKDVSALDSNNTLSVSTTVAGTSDEVIREYDARTGITIITLRPGTNNGQDSWIDYMPSDPSYENGNAGNATQIKVLSWTIKGNLVYSRSLLRFDSLANIPAGKKVIAAKLLLYGPSSSPVYLPQGNSTYPGSPYNYYGQNTTLIRKVTSAWDENTVTWNTQPTTTSIGQDTIPASNSQWNYDVCIDVTNLVRTMLVNNGGTNYGFMLRLAHESVYKSMGFYSSEASDKTKRPKLVVIYR